MDSSQSGYAAYSFQEDRGGVLQLASGNAGLVESLVGGHGVADVKADYNPSFYEDENSTSHNLHLLEERRRQRQRRRQPPALNGTWFAGYRDGHWRWDRCEWETERYREYRMNQKKKFNSDRAQKDDQIWTDEKEELFQYALRYCERLGRRKTKHSPAGDDKLCGRNEIIAIFINTHRPGSIVTTIKNGKENPPRKQVMSHIQTLKNMLKYNPLWMSLVAEPDRGQRPLQPPIDLTTGYPRPRKFSMPCRNPYNSMLHRRKNNALPPPPEVLGSNGIHRVNLEFCVNRRRSPERIHTYTRIQCETGAAPKCLDEVHRWRDDFPQLAVHLDQRQFDGELVHCETSLDFGTEYPVNSELAMITDVVIKEGVKYRDWTSVTYMYERGKRVVGERQQVDVDTQFRALNYEDQKYGSETIVALKYNTKWWAYNIFAEVHKRVLQAKEDSQATQEAIDWGRQFIKNWSMMQEVWARPSGPGTELQRTAIFLWSFQCAQPGEAATTVWRKLTPPSPRISSAPELRPPISTISQVADTSEIGVSSALSLQHAPAYDGSIAYTDQSQELLLTQPSNISTCSDTPGADFKSSFPSSVSSLDPALSNLHESSFDTRDLAYLAEVSTFHAQASGMEDSQQDLPNATYDASQTTGFDSQDATDCSQRSSFSYQESEARMQYTDEEQGVLYNATADNGDAKQEHLTPYYFNPESQTAQIDLEEQRQHQHGVVCAETDIISPAYDHAFTAQLTEMLQRHEMFDSQQQALVNHDPDTPVEDTYSHPRSVTDEGNPGERHFSQGCYSQAPTEGIAIHHQQDPYAIHTLPVPYNHHGVPQPHPTPHEATPYEAEDESAYSQQRAHYPAEPHYHHDPRFDNHTNIIGGTPSHAAVGGHNTASASSAGSSFEMVPTTTLSNMDNRAAADGDYVMVVDDASSSEDPASCLAQWTSEQWNAAMEYASLMSGGGGSNGHVVENVQQQPPPPPQERDTVIEEVSDECEMMWDGDPGRDAEARDR